MPSSPDSSTSDELGADKTYGVGDRPPEDEEFEQALEAIERDLQDLKQRYLQIQQDQQQRADLQKQLGQIQQSLPHQTAERSANLKAELKRIHQQLEALDDALESRLLSWSSLREVFWQAVRFGGIGIVIGWVLKSLRS